MDRIFTINNKILKETNLILKTTDSALDITNAFQDRIDKSNSCDGMFRGSSKTDLAILETLNTSKVTSMRYMFEHCAKLTTIPQLDTSKVTSMTHMFYDCVNLENLPLLNTSKVTDLTMAFYNCGKLKQVEISYFNLDSTSGSQYTFGDSGVQTVIIRNFGSNRVLNSNAFSNCTSLEGIYVPDDLVTTLKTYSGWVNCASKIKPLSSLPSNN